MSEAQVKVLQPPPLTSPGRPPQTVVPTTLAPAGHFGAAGSSWHRVPDAAAEPLWDEFETRAPGGFPERPLPRARGRGGADAHSCSAGGPSLAVSLEKLPADGSGAREPWVAGSSRCLFPRGDKVYLFSEG